MRGRVYAVGGFNGSLRVRTVDMYDPTSDTWSSIASMEARRSTLGVAVFNDMIFAVGGFDGSCGLNTAELLDMSITGNQEWRPIASMSTRRSSVGVGVLGGLIYAVGGYDGNSRQCLASVEVYNPEQGKSENNIQTDILLYPRRPLVSSVRDVRQEERCRGGRPPWPPLQRRGT